MVKKTVQQHQKELLFRVLVAVVLWLVFFVISYININPLVEYLKTEAEKIGYNLIYVRVQDVLLQELRLAAIMALLIDMPVIIYEICRFVFPIFETIKIKILLTIGIFVAIIFFVVGIVFSYKIILPFTLTYLSSVGNAVSITGMVSFKEYISFYIMMLFVMGIVFEMPLFFLILNKVGILTVERMKGIRRYFIVVSFLLAALITPPDVVSQVMVAIPMIILYEVSLFLCKIINHSSKKKENLAGNEVYDGN